MMIVLLLLALGVVAFLFYVCCYSPPAQRVADEIFYDPLEDTVRRHEARMARGDEE